MVFRKTKEEYGGLSNMAAGFQICINGITFRSSEALYQCIRFTEHASIQQQIINQKSPMTAKMISKKYRKNTRDDWHEIRLIVMRWCIRAKLIQNWDSFGGLLLETMDKEIVEESKKDKFWGAIPFEDGTLNGVNALGRLLMELRSDIPNLMSSNELLNPKIPNFKILDNEIRNLKFNFDSQPQGIKKNNSSNIEYLSFFD
ncbi:DUF1768 domain-containing protein [Lysinibacillus sp. B2A1]|nr:DUF1768 domain-containing protein [Lysinibacillus sp. B2A1]